MNNNIQKELQKLEIPNTLHERSRRGVEMAKAERDKLRKPALHRRKQWISFACAFVVVLSIIFGGFYFTGTPDHAANFTITAYASNDEGNQSHANLSPEKATFELATADRLDGGLVSISGGGANLLFTDVSLQITGEQIDTVMFTMNEGKFVEDVTLSAKERADSDWLVAQKINFITTAPDSETSQAIKEIGSSYTVSYDKQENYTLAIPHDGTGAIAEDIRIKVTVTYADGRTEEQTIAVTQVADAISLHLM
ncbi:hypothetical protein DV702_14565 [Sporosarcina sp. PTS2304]|uniref:hypothetical protein n=1 Tax=Sporosarcina sp. PTS2304 TaxID=2283194 RepID=UPI000E0DF137|nr:hypothetical protein [Sporosarcina sp. PTS2304]AXI00821.1 hypothetical protein DV702_14565 [Sporosarcina sp. PTS2304]